MLAVSWLPVYARQIGKEIKKDRLILKDKMLKAVIKRCKKVMKSICTRPNSPFPISCTIFNRELSITGHFVKEFADIMLVPTPLVPKLDAFETREAHRG